MNMEIAFTPSTATPRQGVSSVYSAHVYELEAFMYRCMMYILKFIFTATIWLKPFRQCGGSE
jgi:hypothetical protein